MNPTGGSVDAFIAGVEPAKRRRDAETLVALYRDVTGQEPALWGTIIGFGACEYRYPTGNSGHMPLAAFAPRRAASTIYTLTGFDAFTTELQAIGPHTVGTACLYLKDLERNDLEALRSVIERSYRDATANALEGIQITVTESAS